MTPNEKRASPRPRKRGRPTLIERLTRRGELLAEIVFSLACATVIGAFALLGMWALEWLAIRLGMHKGVEARVLESLKTVGTWAIFFVYLLAEIVVIARRVFKDDQD